MRSTAGRFQDIAAALNLSKGTVSRALSGRGDIAQQTRSRVLEVAGSLNYAPRRRRSRGGAASTVSLDRVGLVLGNPCVDLNGVPDPSYVGFHVLTNLERVANDAGVGLMVSFVDASSPALRLDHLRVLRTRDNDAAILVYPFPDAIVERLASVMPVVSLEVLYPNSPEVDVIGPTHALDAMRAVDHLHRLGHRRIAYVGDELATGHRVTQGLRHAGYVSGLARLGMPYRVATDVSTLATVERSKRTIYRRRSPRWLPTG
ncbi:MAG TPA: LacI family DNA-binding transcriptional regulator [Tepidisphaeraceae bacterium]|jgi:LacI family transcriptional regulator|nr:LacI family DNA-binding transcriptional regulator [Tepidisphaeraceae bacterium]